MVQLAFVFWYNSPHLPLRFIVWSASFQSAFSSAVAVAANTTVVAVNTTVMAANTAVVAANTAVTSDVCYAGSAGNVSGTRNVIAFSPLACTSSAAPRGSSDTNSAAGGGGGNEYADAAAAAKLACCTSVA